MIIYPQKEAQSQRTRTRKEKYIIFFKDVLLKFIVIKLLFIHEEKS